MKKQIQGKSDFQGLLNDLVEAHDKEVNALKLQINELEEEISALKQISAASSNLMNDMNDIMSKGRQARDKMKAYIANGKTGKPTSEDWKALTGLYEIEHHDFLFSLLDQSKGLLTSRDFLVCVLVRDGWTEYDIQILLDMSSERVSNTFRKINSIIFDQDTSKNFIKNILSIDSGKRVFNPPTWIP